MSHSWMPLYVGDYRRDTMHLSTLEHGAYLLLIMHYWETGPLPADPERLARIAGLSVRQFTPLWVTLSVFFREAYDKQMLGKCFHHKRIDEELEKLENISLKRAYAGGKGGRAPRKQYGFVTHDRKQMLSKGGVQPQPHISSASSQSVPEPPPERRATELVIGEPDAFDHKPPNQETRAEYDARLAAKRSAAPEPEAPRRRITMAEYASLIEARRRG